MEKQIQDPSKREPTDTPSVSASGHYYVEDNDEDTNGEGATPFSSDMPIIEIEDERQPRHSAVPQTHKRGSQLFKIALIATTLVVASGFLWFVVFAQPAQPLATQRVATTAPPSPTQQAQGPITPTEEGVTWMPEPLPTGWANAGLTMGDGIEALRTACAFTDREEGIDFRNLGTRAQHGGTLIAATFILTPGGKARFTNNDVRVANNALFDRVARVQLIQAAVNPIPDLTMFAAQGGNQFAWVDVSYELFLSQSDPTGQRIEGLEMDATTNQPLVHHMSVLLVRVTPGIQGADAPMGDSGWLVSNYGLDLQTPLTLLQPI